MTVREVLDWYLREHVGVDPETGDSVTGADGVAAPERQVIAARHLRAYWGDAPVSGVDETETKAYREHRAAATPAAGASTVRRELNMLVAAANHAIKRRRLDKDDAPRVELPPHAPPDELKFFTKTELKALFAETAADPDPRVHAFAVLAYFSAARRKRIERIQKSQIDLQRRRMTLTPPGTRRTKKRAPPIVINDDMSAQIRVLMLWSGSSDYLFRDPGYDVYHRYADACRRAGLDDRTGPHVLRHSRATHMLEDGEDIWAVAKLLGDTVTTVERVYGHVSPDYLAGLAAFKPLASILG